MIKNKKILETKELYKKCILQLISYKIKESEIAKTKEPETIHEKYYLKKIFNETPAKDILKEILFKKKDIYGLLKENYIDIADKTSDLSCYHRQAIESIKDEDDYYDNYTDVRDIILSLMAISLSNVEADSSDEIKSLIGSDLIMFKKLGFYAIAKNQEKYLDIFSKFLESSPATEESLEKLYICKYEILTILENLSNTEMVSKEQDECEDDKITQSITKFLDRINDNSDNRETKTKINA